jgi:hypothetical protein
MTELIYSGLVRLVPYPIPEPYRTRLIIAGKAAVFAAWTHDSDRKPDFAGIQAKPEKVKDIVDQLFAARGAYYPMRKGIDTGIEGEGK